MKSRKTLIGVSILGVCALTAFGLFTRNRQQAAAEMEIRSALEKLGALVTLDGNQQHVQGIAFLPSTSQEKLTEAIPLIAQLPRLEVLRMAKTKIEDQQLAQIDGISSLTMLGLNKTSISNTGLAHLRNLKRIEALYLRGTKVTEQGLKAIGRLSSIKILDLSETKLESDLAPLLPLNQLNHLLLTGIELNDDAVDNLLRLKSLSRLTIRSGHLSDQAINKLKQADIQLDRAEVQGKGTKEETSPTEEDANTTSPNESSDSSE